MILYKKRPLKDASTIAWDYITEKYGEPKEMIFNTPCCGHTPFWTAKINGKMVSVEPKEIRGFVPNRGKLNFQSANRKTKI